jgi:hypothetical protein
VSSGAFWWLLVSFSGFWVLLSFDGLRRVLVRFGEFC